MAKGQNRLAGGTNGSGVNGAAPVQLPAVLVDAAGMITINNNDRLLNQLWGPISPDRLASILREAVVGNLIWQKRLFEKMCDEWPRLQKNIQTLKRDVAGLPWMLSPFTAKGVDPTPSAQAKADLVEEVLFGMKGDMVWHEKGFDGLVKDIVDAIPTGISVSEIYWDSQTKFSPVSDGLEMGRTIAVPRCTRKLPPRFYGYSMQPEEPDRLMLNPTGLLSFSQENLEDFYQYPNKFLVGIHCAHDSHPTISATLRSLTGWWLASKYGLKWFMVYCQLFGVPFRTAEVPDGSPTVKNDVSNMLAQLGNAGWAVFPTGVNLTIHDTKQSNGTVLPQRVLMEDADEQADLLILGQTLTSSVRMAGGNRALGEVHAETERKIINGAADFVTDVINNQFIPAILRMNFGEDSEPPNLSGSQEEPADDLAIANRAAILFGKGPGQLGLPVSNKDIYELVSVTQPADTDDLFDPNVSANPADGQPSDGMTGLRSDKLPADNIPADKIAAIRKRLKARTE